MKNATLITSVLALFIFLAAPNLKANDDLGGAYALFAEKFGGELNQKEIKNTTELGIAGCAAGSVFTQFTLVLYKKGKATRYKGTDGKLTKTMIKGLSGLIKGDTFELVNMKARLPEGGKVDVMGKIFTVV